MLILDYVYFTIERTNHVKNVILDQSERSISLKRYRAPCDKNQNNEILDRFLDIFYCNKMFE